ncbi:siroheme decarboxylase subunit beta [Azospirillum agricola]|uniref:siroheme decarboxylase subunit beta n=1 Tax=Azospirillum agricola TaxID=1720247 RepID=UPI000A0EEBDB|nr:Lrp/AsnC family transcriptional regulator [Azospirillum agricola]SMH45741.1 transcriptional regulator, AsnC family [Azospirillum lipoferum]
MALTETLERERDRPADRSDGRLLRRLRDGLPLVARPFLAIGQAIGRSEADVIAAIRELVETGAASRFGVIVDHAALGFTANAMVVWDVPDERVDAVGAALGGRRGVSLCYRRPRRPPVWPYNLFTMIHGRDRDEVRALVEELAAGCDLAGVPRELLFTARRFKQTAPCYGRDRRA